MREVTTAANKSSSSSLSKNHNPAAHNGANSTSAANGSGSQFEVSIGQKVEVLDFCNIWRTGQIRLLDAWDKTVCVHYDGTDDLTEDEWLEVGSGRLRPFKDSAKDAFKIPKADRVKQLAMASSISQESNLDAENSDGKKAACVPKLFAKERKVAQFRKGTFVLATWIDRLMYPAVIVRVLNEVSFLVEFVDGTRWALGAQCLTRTLSRTEYERLMENPQDANDIIGPRRLFSPPNSPNNAAPPRKRFRLASPAGAAAPSPARRGVKAIQTPDNKSRVNIAKGRSSAKKVIVSASKSKKRGSLPLKSLNKTPIVNRVTEQPKSEVPAAAAGRGGRRKSVPALGGSESGFTSKASVRSVSPLPENGTSPAVKNLEAQSKRVGGRRSTRFNSVEDDDMKPTVEVIKAPDSQAEESDKSKAVSARSRRSLRGSITSPPFEKENVRKSRKSKPEVLEPMDMTEAALVTDDQPVAESDLISSSEAKLGEIVTQASAFEEAGEPSANAPTSITTSPIITSSKQRLNEAATTTTEGGQPRSLRSSSGSRNALNKTDANETPVKESQPLVEDSLITNAVNDNTL